jgi:hypothetical protein
LKILTNSTDGKELKCFFSSLFSLTNSDILQAISVSKYKNSRNVDFFPGFIRIFTFI